MLRFGNASAYIALPHRVIVVPVGVYQIAHGLVGPSTDLRNILPGLGGEIAGVHDEDFSVPDDDLGVPVGDAIGRVLVPDHVDAARHFGYAALFGNRGIGQTDGGAHEQCEQRAQLEARRV